MPSPGPPRCTAWARGLGRAHRGGRTGWHGSGSPSASRRARRGTLGSRSPTRPSRGGQCHGGPAVHRPRPRPGGPGGAPGPLDQPAHCRGVPAGPAVVPGGRRAPPARPAGGPAGVAWPGSPAGRSRSCGRSATGGRSGAMAAGRLARLQTRMLQGLAADEPRTRGCSRAVPRSGWRPSPGPRATAGIVCVAWRRRACSCCAARPVAKPHVALCPPQVVRRPANVQEGMTKGGPTSKTRGEERSRRPRAWARG